MESRIYPACCTSAFCGRADCDGCPNLPTLEAFRQWQGETAALPADPIWSPNVYRATREPVKGDPGYRRELVVTPEHGPQYEAPAWYLARSWRNDSRMQDAIRRACLEGIPAEVYTPAGCLFLRRA